jgi:ribosomal protein S20
MKTIDKAVSKGVLHRNNGARRISRLSQQVAALKSA